MAATEQSDDRQKREKGPLSRMEFEFQTRHTAIRSPIAVREASGALGFVVKGRLPFPLQIVWGFV